MWVRGKVGEERGKGRWVRMWVSVGERKGEVDEEGDRKVG